MKVAQKLFIRGSHAPFLSLKWRNSQMTNGFGEPRKLGQGKKAEGSEAKTSPAYDVVFGPFLSKAYRATTYNPICLVSFEPTRI